MASVTNINDVLEGHVALEIDCVDRLLLNAYVPALQVPGQVVRFLCGHLGHPIPSPALLGRIGNRFRSQARKFADERGIPVLRLGSPDRSRWDDRKVDHVRPHLQRAEREGRFGVVALVVGEEFQHVWSARNRARKPGMAVIDFFRERRRVGAYYFYIHDPEFGLGFIKICTYAPYSAKVWVNGHEWAKRQALRYGIGYTELENGFASCPEPERLQTICDSFSPEHVQAFFDRWITQIPTPLGSEDRAAGYWWELSMRQVEVSRTLVLDDPRRARAFFETLVADNVGIGRPEQVSLVFARRVTKATREPFRTRVLSAGSDVRIEFRYKHSRVKQYLKGSRALRVETVINKPSDLDVPARLHNLPALIDKTRAVNHRLLMIEQAGQSCAIGSALFERIHQPYNHEGQRTGALRFGDTRATALAGALCQLLPAVTGFTNKSLRGLVAGLLDQDYSYSYSQSKMSYDLRRLRLHGLIQRLPHSNTYVLTPEGIRVAVFYTKLQNRLLRPLLDADKPPARIEIRQALKTLDNAVKDYIQNARLAPAT
ncbi:MAG TPA: hypothetical protein VGI50_08200 [Solirubrobacteraceae bacterium]